MLSSRTAPRDLIRRLPLAAEHAVRVDAGEGEDAQHGEHDRGTEDRLDGSQLVSEWTAEVGDQVQVEEEPEHDDPDDQHESASDDPLHKAPRDGHPVGLATLRMEDRGLTHGEVGHAGLEPAWNAREDGQERDQQRDDGVFGGDASFGTLCESHEAAYKLVYIYQLRGWK